MQIKSQQSNIRVKIGLRTYLGQQEDYFISLPLTDVRLWGIGHQVKTRDRIYRNRMALENFVSDLFRPTLSKDSKCRSIHQHIHWKNKYDGLEIDCHELFQWCTFTLKINVNVFKHKKLILRTNKMLINKDVPSKNE